MTKEGMYMENPANTLVESSIETKVESDGGESGLNSWRLFSKMLRSRLFEEEVKRLWLEGAIPGQMHMSMGEEGVVVGIVDQLVDGDALALDHRATTAMLVRGVDPVLMLKEFMGRSDGLDGGMGGHMHLFSPEHLAASSGIVGASGPAGVGFALANQRLRPGKISVAFFGEGATNEGMMLEAFNLAVAWKLPVMFVCKDNGLAVVTQRQSVTGGNLVERAKGFGLRVVEADGSDVEDVWELANEEIRRLRNGDGPVFMYATCVHLEGHFLGDQALRMAHPSVSETLKMGAALVKAHTQSRGAPLRERTASLREMLSILRESARIHRSKEGDPILILREKLAVADAEKLQSIEQQIHIEIREIVRLATASHEGVGGLQP
jgi:acetoin:2,6-dichlorophenolindophenol oxidoreductase subunit alpha